MSQRLALNNYDSIYFVTHVHSPQLQHWSSILVIPQRLTTFCQSQHVVQYGKNVKVSSFLLASAVLQLTYHHVFQLLKFTTLMSVLSASRIDGKTCIKQSLTWSLRWRWVHCESIIGPSYQLQHLPKRYGSTVFQLKENSDMLMVTLKTITGHLHPQWAINGQIASTVQRLVMLWMIDYRKVMNWQTTSRHHVWATM